MNTDHTQPMEALQSKSRLFRPGVKPKVTLLDVIFGGISPTRRIINSRTSIKRHKRGKYQTVAQHLRIQKKWDRKYGTELLKDRLERTRVALVASCRKPLTSSDHMSLNTAIKFDDMDGVAKSITDRNV